MKTFTVNSIAKWTGVLAVVLGAASLCGCSVLSKTASPPPVFYALDGLTGRGAQSVPRAASGAKLTLIISPPHAASGFDSQRIVYVRADHQLEYFAHSEWVDPPARMLGPLLVSAAQQTGAFAAVVLASGTAAGDLRLNIDILRLQHNFQSSPSRVQLTLLAYLTDEKSRRVLAWQEFSGEAVAASGTPQGGVAAANQVVQEVLAQLAQFLVDRPR
jgi:cholesterol transport system auxiliary component